MKVGIGVLSMDGFTISRVTAPCSGVVFNQMLLNSSAYGVKICKCQTHYWNLCYLQWREELPINKTKAYLTWLSCTVANKACHTCGQAVTYEIARSFPQKRLRYRGKCWQWKRLRLEDGSEQCSWACSAVLPEMCPPTTSRMSGTAGKEAYGSNTHAQNVPNAIFHCGKQNSPPTTSFTLDSTNKFKIYWTLYR